MTKFSSALTQFQKHCHPIFYVYIEKLKIFPLKNSQITKNRKWNLKVQRAWCKQFKERNPVD